MYHSMMAFAGAETVYLHGSCAVSPFIASTVGATSTFTDAWHTVGGGRKKKDRDSNFKSLILSLVNSDCQQGKT